MCFPEAVYSMLLDEYAATDISIVNAKDLRDHTAHWNASMIATLIPVPSGHRQLGVGIHGPTERIRERADFLTGKLRELTRKLGDGLEKETA